MGIIQNVVRWYKLNLGVGKQMVNEGAALMSCPYCDEATPVFQSTYNSDGLPISFSVCLWCNGFIEYGRTSLQTHEPYATAQDSQTEERESKP